MGYEKKVLGLLSNSPFFVHHSHRCSLSLPLRLSNPAFSREEALFLSRHMSEKGDPGQQQHQDMRR
jgi:hypothetical protein